MVPEHGYERRLPRPSSRLASPMGRTKFPPRPPSSTMRRSSRWGWASATTPGSLAAATPPGSFTQATGDDFYLSAFPEVVVDDTGDAAYTSGDDTGSGNGVYHVDETGFLRVTDRYGTGYAPFVDGTFLGGDDGSFTVVPFVIEVGSGGGTTLPPLPSSVVEAVEFIISRDVSLKFAGPMAAGEGTVNYTLKVTNEDDFAPTDAKVEFFAKDETDMGSRGVFFASSVDVDPTARTGTWECHTGRLGPHTLACTVFGLGPGDSAVLDFTATSGFTTTVEVDDFSFELVETGRFPVAHLPRGDGATDGWRGGCRR